jgi:hypothetical protein
MLHVVGIVHIMRGSVGVGRFLCDLIGDATRGRVFNRMNRHFRGFLVSFRVLYLLLPSKNFWTADVKKLFTVGVYFILERGLLVDVELLGGGG